jgi:tetratricopeptide (TPR) repeat protein
MAQEAGDQKALFQLLLLRMRSRMMLDDIEGIIEDSDQAAILANAQENRTGFAEAILGRASASRLTGSKEDAVRCGEQAFRAAIEAGDTDLALFCAGECIHTHTVFWQFDKAVEMLKRGEELLRRASVGVEANFLYNASQLLYLLDRYDEAIAYATRGLEVVASQRFVSSRYVPDRQRTIATLTNMRALSAAAAGNWPQALADAESFASNPAAQSAPARAHAADILVRALLGRNEPGDAERAEDLLRSLDESALTPDTRMYVASAKARIAARKRSPLAPALLERAIEVAEEVAQTASLDVDSIFADLAASARECGASEQATTASDLRDRYFALRRGAAGVHFAR